jgi:hypothetical protein
MTSNTTLFLSYPLTGSLRYGCASSRLQASKSSGEPLLITRSFRVGIFAGRLYFEYSEYRPLCDYLGLQEDNLKIEDAEIEDEFGLDGMNEEEDGAVQEESVDEERKVFCKKPLVFLQEFLALRRKGQDFSHTPMGHLCQGKPMSEGHPFFMKPVHKHSDEVQQVTTTDHVKSAEDDVDDDIFDEVYGDDVDAAEADKFDDSKLFVASRGSDESLCMIDD